VRKNKNENYKNSLGGIVMSEGKRLRSMLKYPVARILVLAIVIGGLAGGLIVWQFLFGGQGTQEEVWEIQAVIETEPVITGDGPDDPAIWLHPSDPAQSTIITTDKGFGSETGGGLRVYDLDGQEIQSLKGTRPNNVDLRYNFRLNGESVTLVTAGNRLDNTIMIYTINPDTRQLENAATRSIPVDLPEAYGSCMYLSPISGKYYIFITTKKKGKVNQFELFDNGHGLVDARLVRSFEVGSVAEGCVADDILDHLYIGEEGVGIWKYGAEPDASDSRTLVDKARWYGRLIEDVEGLTLYYATENTGYLIASSQGSSRFVVYDRQGDNPYIGTFRVATGENSDEVSGTDGIDVTNVPLNENFPAGLFVAQDHKNTDVKGSQNFKLVSWQDIAKAFEPELLIDTSWNPRLVGTH
jgi:3-phytase